MSDFSVGESPVDLPPVSHDDGVLRCETCGQGPLYYGGRGRKPRFCEDHKPNKSSNTGNNTGSLHALEVSLTQFYTMVGMGVAMIEPFDGMAIGNGANDLAKAWVDLARNNPKVRKALQKMMTGSGAGGVIMAHAFIAYPILEHHGMLPQFLGEKGKSRADAE